MQLIKVFECISLLEYLDGTSSLVVVQEVFTTGYSFMTPSGRISKYGIFWGPDDPRNVIREVPGVTHVAAMLMAIIDAVRIVSQCRFRFGDEMNTNGEMATTSSNDWPVVYTMAMCKSSNNGFNSASYVTVWSDKRCGQNTMHRLAMMPVTLFRAQLAAIEEALRQAVDNRLPRVVVVTDSQAFLLNWRKGWLKTTGSPVPNKFLYDRIRDLTQSDTEVRFRYEAPQADNSMWSEAIDKCFEAIDLPLVGKDRSEYKRDISEVKDMNKRGGIIWETDGKIHHGLINILEKATSVGFKHIVVRTNSVRLILASENWLPIWHRNGWRNSLHKPIADADSWKKIWWLKKTVYWELMDPPNDDDKAAAAQLFFSDDVNELQL
ncbi:unnamed protein product [Angiostrongylus costaricensis]|uniref:ribonuclease H n=1 Tax=Angiostrongylus costaricensis TaxID=334426 RepID=A0A3P7K6C1_ANGCS|nr:unnamed protein product [Angiostrongylus costaricensis]